MYVCIQNYWNIGINDVVHWQSFHFTWIWISAFTVIYLSRRNNIMVFIIAYLFGWVCFGLQGASPWVAAHTNIFYLLDLQLKYEKRIGTREAAKTVSDARTHRQAYTKAAMRCMCACVWLCGTWRWLAKAFSFHFHPLYTYRLYIVGVCVCAHKFGVAIDKRLWRHGRWSYFFVFLDGQRNDQKP